MVALGNNAAREAGASGQPLFWGGLIVIYAPIAFRLLSTSASRAERIALVLTLGLSLFAVRILYSPDVPTPYDELSSWRQTSDLIHTGHLFSFNPLVEGYAGFPGLETITATVSQLAGLSIFHSGQIVIGVGRATLMLALFVFLERVIHSPRAAGIGVALYAGNPSFVYFDAEQGHESLALPIAAAMLLLALRWSECSRQQKTSDFGKSLAVAMVAVASTLTITHHMSSYATALFLILWAAFSAWDERKPGAHLRLSRIKTDARASLAALGRFLLRGPALPALAMTATAVAWFVFVSGGYTVNELGGVLTGSIKALVNALFGESETKVLFQGGGRSNSTAARTLAIGSILPLLALIPLGLYRVWRGARSTPLWRVLALAATLYPLTLGLRLTLAGSETSQRASEFVFVGLAFFAGLLVSEMRWPKPLGRRLARASALTALGTAVFLGGVIVSTLPANRQPGPFLVSAEARSIGAPAFAAARFAAENLEPGGRVLADRPNATLLGSFGHVNPVFGQIDGIPVTRVLFSKRFDRLDRRVIEDDEIRYIVVDWRQSFELPLIGYYVESFEPGAFTRRRPIGEAALRKFDSVPGLSKIFSNRAIAIYDTAGLR